ncbi:MAG: FAD-dependent monooxygenase [Acidimicrobiales bacterium]
MKDLTLLDVFSGSAYSWVRDGLMLIGDSAHTHSPMGARGINLALQDAARLHPYVVHSQVEVPADGHGGPRWWPVRVSHTVPLAGTSPMGENWAWPPADAEVFMAFETVS